MPPPVIGNTLLGSYDASTLGLANGAAVGTWPDLSGNGFDLLDQGGDPTYVLPALNGMGGVLFSATNARRRATGVTSHTNATMFIVCINPPNTGGSGGIHYFNDQTVRKPFFAKWSNANRWIWGVADTGGFFIEFTEAGITEQAGIWTGTIQATGALLRWNQTQKVSGNLAGVGATTGIEIGSPDDADFTVCEYLYYSGIVSGTDIDTIEDYLFDKWFVPPPDPPDAPGNVTATAQGQTSILVEWDDVADEDGFRVERSLTGVGGWSEVSDQAAGDLDYLDAGLTCNTEYFYRVFAYNGDGDSPASSTASATTAACDPPPSGGNRMGGTGAIRRTPSR